MTVTMIMQKFEEAIKEPLTVLQPESAVKEPVVPLPLRATDGTKMEIGKAGNGKIHVRRK